MAETGMVITLTAEVENREPEGKDLRSGCSSTITGILGDPSEMGDVARSNLVIAFHDFLMEVTQGCANPVLIKLGGHCLIVPPRK